MHEDEAIICVIDDDPAVRIATASLLRSADFTVETFASAEAFLRRPRVEAPACLVLDVGLSGMSGLELQRTLTEAKRPIPIIFITAQDDPSVAVRALQAGAVAFLRKPFHARDLFDALEEAIARDRATRRRHIALATRRGRQHPIG
jgi:FixJ family two-component response regulator